MKKLLVFAILVLIPLMLFADKSVKRSTAPNSDPSSGAQMYNDYCASCHGHSGKGDGPVASSLKSLPADLTTLSANNKGEFPAMHVRSIILGDVNAPAHGSQEMPVWGSVFLGLDKEAKARTDQRVYNLTRYVESLQAK